MPRQTGLRHTDGTPCRGETCAFRQDGAHRTEGQYLGDIRTRFSLVIEIDLDAYEAEYGNGESAVQAEAYVAELITTAAEDRLAQVGGYATVRRES